MAQSRLVVGPLRILPVTIAVATLTLALRAGELWTDVRVTLTGEAEAQATLEQLIVPAAGGKDAEADEHGDPESEHHSEADSSGDATHDADAHQNGSGEDSHASASHAGDAEGGAGSSLPLPDLIGTPNFSPAEIEVLTELAKRREDLEGRERELGLREGLLQAAEQRVEDKIAELQQLRSEIEALVRLHDEQEEAELQSLVKIYETMKPKDAARILQELEIDVLLSIMERMKERSTAPVLAAMDAERAREVTAELARRDALELPKG